MPYQDEAINQLIINKLSQDQYNELAEAGAISANQLYFVEADGDIDAASGTIENVADPINNTDAANKQYVDNTISSNLSNLSSTVSSTYALKTQILDAEDLGLSNYAPLSTVTNLNNSLSSVYSTKSDVTYVSSQVSGIPNDIISVSNSLSGYSTKSDVTYVSSQVSGIPDVITNLSSTISSNYLDTNISNIIIGPNAYAYTEAIAIGISANANRKSAIAIGSSAFVDGSRSMALGYGANAYSQSDIAIGYKPSADNFSIAIGDIPNASSRSVGIGTSVSATSYGTAVGDSSIAIDSSTSLGGNTSSVNQSVAIGRYAYAENKAIAIGNNSYSTSGSVAIGINVKTDDTTPIKIRGSIKSTGVNKPDFVDIIINNDGIMRLDQGYYSVYEESGYAISASNTLAFTSDIDKLSGTYATKTFVQDSLSAVNLTDLSSTISSNYTLLSTTTDLSNTLSSYSLSSDVSSTINKVSNIASSLSALSDISQIPAEYTIDTVVQKLNEVIIRINTLTTSLK